MCYYHIVALRQNLTSFDGQCINNSGVNIVQSRMCRSVSNFGNLCLKVLLSEIKIQIEDGQE